MPKLQLKCGDRLLDLSRPQIMGVLNVTPDSFSDGGQFVSAQSALNHAEKMVAEGAAIIDVGGESTRPGADPVSVEQELERVVPVVEALAGRVDAVISVDTSTPQVMAQSAAAVAGLINDVRALKRPGAMEAALLTQLPVCLMHMQGQPQSMQDNPSYGSVVDEVFGFFEARVAECAAAGFPRERLLLDPGFGFGKTLDHNLGLLKHLSRFKQLDLPILVGMSRKSMIGNILHKPVEKRLYGSVAAALIAVGNGANIIRVHDVEATVDALKVQQAVYETP